MVVGDSDLSVGIGELVPDLCASNGLDSLGAGVFARDRVRGGLTAWCKQRFYTALEMGCLPLSDEVRTGELENERSSAEDVVRPEHLVRGLSGIHTSACTKEAAIQKRDPRLRRRLLRVGNLLYASIRTSQHLDTVVHSRTIQS